MPRGAPDYSNVLSNEPLHRLDDMAELAARLGSVVTFDRAGQVIYLETFCRGFPQWAGLEYGTGAAVELTSLRAASPPFSVGMTTGSDGQRGALIEYELPYHHLCKVGLEYSFTHTVDSEEHNVMLYHRDGTTRYEYLVKFKIQDGEIWAYDSDGAYKTFVTGLNLKSDAWVFNQAKLVVDLETNKYVRFTFNDQTWLLDDYSAHQVAESSVPYLSVMAYFKGDAGNNRTHYVDNVIVTQNEP